ncbi:MAG TPA: hypothetical protein PKE32_05890, partial [Miltoncostaeaceae bacterium]|nr:hypothetical protein [Miltoncostaeaceae bacterium]
TVWSGGLGRCDVSPRVRPRVGMAVVAVAGGLLAALGIADLALNWLTLMALSAPGLVVLCVIALPGRDATPVSWRLAPLTAWVIGIVCAISLQMAGFTIALPAAAVVPAVVYRLLT